MLPFSIALRTSSAFRRGRRSASVRDVFGARPRVRCNGTFIFGMATPYNLRSRRSVYVPSGGLLYANARSPPSPGPAVSSPSPVRRAKREASINNGDVTPATDKADHRAAFAREADRSTTSFRSGLYTAEKPRQLLFLGLGVIAIIYTAYKREVSSPEHVSHPLPAALAAGAILFLVYCSLQLRDGGYCTYILPTGAST